MNSMFILLPNMLEDEAKNPDLLVLKQIIPTTFGAYYSNKNVLLWTIGNLSPVYPGRTRVSLTEVKSFVMWMELTLVHPALDPR